MGKLHFPGTWNRLSTDVDWEPIPGRYSDRIFCTSVDCEVQILNNAKFSRKELKINLKKNSVLVMHFDEKGNPDHYMINGYLNNILDWYSSRCDCCGERIA